MNPTLTVVLKKIIKSQSMIVVLKKIVKPRHKENCKTTIFYSYYDKKYFFYGYYDKKYFKNNIKITILLKWT